MTDRQLEILDATKKIFTEKGYYGTTMNAIAEAVGIRKASLYAHFRHKDEIIEILFQQVLKEHRDYIDVLLTQMAGHGVKNQMYIHLRDYVNFCYNNPSVELWNHFYYYPPEGMADWIRDSTHEQEAIIRNYMMDLIIKSQEEGIIRDFDPKIVHQLYYNLCLGFVMSAPEYESLEMANTIKSSFILFWDAIKAGPDR